MYIKILLYNWTAVVLKQDGESKILPIMKMIGHAGMSGFLPESGTLTSIWVGTEEKVFFLSRALSGRLGDLVLSGLGPDGGRGTAWPKDKHIQGLS